MLRSNRGQVKVLEAFLASVIVFSAFLIAAPGLIHLVSPNDSGVLYSMGMNVLAELDKDGGLGQLIAQSSWHTLSTRLSMLLPSGISYNLTVYDENMTVVNNKPISSGGLLNGNVVSCAYVLVAETRCKFYAIRLQLAWPT